MQVLYEIEGALLEVSTCEYGTVEEDFDHFISKPLVVFLLLSLTLPTIALF